MNEKIFSAKADSVPLDKSKPSRCNVQSLNELYNGLVYLHIKKMLSKSLSHRTAYKYYKNTVSSM